MTIMFNVADWLKKYEHKLNVTSAEKQLLIIDSAISFTKKVKHESKT